MTVWGGRGRLKKARLYALIALVLVFVWLMTLAVSGSVSNAEREIFRWLYDMPESLRGFALVVTQAGSAWILLGIMGLLFVTRWNPKAALAVFRNSLTVYVLVLLTKVIIARPRPDNLLDNITSREFFTYGHGFPSGHTALATVISLTLISFLPKRWRWIPIPWIGLVAWSRMYLGVHVPLDVLGGFVLGLIVVLGADFIPRLKKSS